MISPSTKNVENLHGAMAALLALPTYLGCRSNMHSAEVTHRQFSGKAIIGVKDLLLPLVPLFCSRRGENLDQLAEVQEVLRQLWEEIGEGSFAPYWPVPHQGCSAVDAFKLMVRQAEQESHIAKARSLLQAAADVATSSRSADRFRIIARLIAKIADELGLLAELDIDGYVEDIGEIHA